MKIARDETSAHSPRPGAATEPGPLPGHARAGLGIGHAPEDRRPIADLTVEEGILVPALARRMVTTPLIPLVMKGKTVVATQGSNAVGFAQALSAQGMDLNLAQAKDHAESFLMLTSGRAAAFMEDDILLAGLRAAAPDPSALAFLPEAYDRIYYGLMFTKDDAAFKAVVDDTLKGLMASGEFTAIYDKWFTQPIPPRNENLDFAMGETLKERVANPSDAVE